MKVTGEFKAPAALSLSIGCWVNPRVGLHVVRKIKITTSVGNRTPVVQLVVSYFSDLYLYF